MSCPPHGKNGSCGFEDFLQPVANRHGARHDGLGRAMGLGWAESYRFQTQYDGDHIEKTVAERAGVSRLGGVAPPFTLGGLGLGQRPAPRWKRPRWKLGYSPNAAGLVADDRAAPSSSVLVSNNFHNPLFLEVFDPLHPGPCRIGGPAPASGQSQWTRPIPREFCAHARAIFGSRRGGDRRPPSDPAAQLFAEAFPKRGPCPSFIPSGRYTTAPYVHVVGIDQTSPAGRMAAEAAGRPGATAAWRFLGRAGKGPPPRRTGRWAFSARLAETPPRSRANRQLCQRLFLRCKAGSR